MCARAPPGNQRYFDTLHIARVGAFGVMLLLDRVDSGGFGQRPNRLGKRSCDDPRMRKLLPVLGAVGSISGLAALGLFVWWERQPPERVNFAYVGDDEWSGDFAPVLIALPVAGLVVGLLARAVLGLTGWRLTRGE